MKINRNRLSGLSDYYPAAREPKKLLKSLDCRDCFVRLSSIFSELTEDEILKWKKLQSKNIYKKHSIIFYEGNKPFGLYILCAGRVKLYKSTPEGKQQIVKIINPGEIFGEKSLFANDNYTASAETLELSQINFIEKQLFFKFLAEHPNLSIKIINNLSKELKIAQNRLRDFAYKSAREKVADLLVRLASDYGIPENNSIRIGIYLSREELAQIIGLSKETTIRLLSDFKKEGLIDEAMKKIAVKNLSKLCEISGL